MFRIFKCLFIFLAFSDFVSAQDLSAFQSNFIRKVTMGSESETIKGTIYYESSRMIIEINYPIRQIFIINDLSVTIFYPQENKAFRFTGPEGAFSPFILSFLGMVKEDFGLAEAGFLITKREKEDDLLLTYWKPPKNIEKKISSIKLGTKSNLPFSLTVFDPSAELLFRVIYSEYKNFGAMVFPGEVLVEQQRDGEIYKQHIIYSEQKVNIPLAREITEFELPKDVLIKEVAW